MCDGTTKSAVQAYITRSAFDLLLCEGHAGHDWEEEGPKPHQDCGRGWWIQRIGREQKDVDGERAEGGQSAGAPQVPDGAVPRGASGQPRRGEPQQLNLPRQGLQPHAQDVARDRQTGVAAIRAAVPPHVRGRVDDIRRRLGVGWRLGGGAHDVEDEQGGPGVEGADHKVE